MVYDGTVGGGTKEVSGPGLSSSSVLMIGRHVGPRVGNKVLEFSRSLYFHHRARAVVLVAFINEQGVKNVAT